MAAVNNVFKWFRSLRHQPSEDNFLLAMAASVALSTSDLPELMEHLRNYLPNALSIYSTADNTSRGRLSLQEVQFYVDKWPHPICVALVSPAYCGQLFNYRTTVDLWAKDTNNAVKFLDDLDILDWNQPIFFRVQPFSDSQFKALQIKFEQRSGTYSCVKRHIYSVDSASLQLKPPPPGYTLLEKLNQHDAETVGRQYSAWGVDPPDTICYFQACCSRLPSSGIHADDGKLVSYVVLHHTGAFGSVATDSQHQHKGLGTTVVTDICSKMIKDNQIPYVYVNPENIASAKLYEKCGFKFKTLAYRIRYVPKESRENILP